MTTRSLRRALVAVALSALVSALPAAAQLPPEDTRQDRPPRPRREELHGMLDAYVISKLQEALRLSDEQYARVIVAQKKLDEQRRDYHRDRRELLQRLRQALAADKPSEAELSSLLERLEALRSEFEARQKAAHAALDALLTVEQRARYRLFMVEIEGRMQEMMREVRRLRRGAGPPRAPRAPQEETRPRLDVGPGPA